jgi:hypothetical protein
MSSREIVEKKQEVSRDSGAAGQKARKKRPPLLQELEEIGRHEKCLRPAALAGYPHLLSCPEVSRRAKQDKNRTPADHASAALHDAIKEIVDATDQLIACAVLCAKPEYEGQPVADRKDFLEKHHYIPTHVYRDRRPRILTWILHYLDPLYVETSEPSNKEEALSADTSETAKWPYTGLRDMTLRAASLYYLSLATLFVASQDSKTFQSNTPGTSYGRPAALKQLCEMSFDATASFIGYSSLFKWGLGEFADRDNDTVDWEQDSHLSVLSRLLDEAQYASPMNEDWEFTLASRAASGLPIAGIDRQTMLEKYSEWFAANASALTRLPAGDIERARAAGGFNAIAGSSGAFAALTSLVYPAYELPVRHVRWEVFYTVLEFYPHSPVAEHEGESFADHLVRFFDTVGRGLTKPYESWDNRPKLLEPFHGES